MTMSNFKWETIWNCFVISFTYKTDLFIGALLVDRSPSTMQLPFTIWCINSEIHIINSKEDSVSFVDC